MLPTTWPPSLRIPFPHSSATAGFVAVPFHIGAMEAFTCLMAAARKEEFASGRFPEGQKLPESAYCLAIKQSVAA